MTRKLFLLVLLVACTAFAQSQADPAAKAKSATVQRTAAQKEAATLPPNAEKISDGVWKAKDAAGKTWIYTKTPFGFSKGEEGADRPAVQQSSGPELQVVAFNGATAKFEKQTPFGKSVWTKKVEELNEEEQAACAKKGYDLKQNTAAKTEQK
jgi:hypothetical protein